MKRNLTVILFIVVLSCAAVYQNVAKGKGQPVSNQEEAPKINYLAPSFSLGDKGGKQYEIGGKRDKLLLINFWASWCGPCEVEAPDLKSFYEKYKGQMDLYAVNATKYDTIEDAQAFAEKFDFTFPVLFDRKGVAASLYWVEGFPTSFLIDKEGIIRDIIYGALPPKELEQRIKKLIE